MYLPDTDFLEIYYSITNDSLGEKREILLAYITETKEKTYIQQLINEKTNTHVNAFNIGRLMHDLLWLDSPLREFFWRRQEF